MVKYCIDFNLDKRKDAVSSLEKDFFRLMNNSVYGKTIKNSRKRIKIRLVNNALDYQKYMSKPSFVSQKLFN